MKLSSGGADAGYPMSDYVKVLDSKLSYVAREISCHAIEVYCERLMKGEYEDLKVSSGSYHMLLKTLLSTAILF